VNFYNEHDPKAAAWLRELITGGHIPAGIVDERSITEISPHELTKYTQCHFFAGIGGWSLALELAGWPASRPVWTGSCPCQPFSGAGEGKGASDDRHLWPVFRRLIAKLHPERVFGEQVAQAIGFNWLDGVSADLEADGYEVGAVVLGAHSVGAPHIRQRLYWLANSNGQQELAANASRLHAESGSGGTHGRLANANGGRCEQRDASLGPVPISGTHRTAGGLGNAHRGHQSERNLGPLQSRFSTPHGTNDPRSSVWDDAEAIGCRDGKFRRIESGTCPVAHGVPGRVGLLRGYGNAIVPQVAAEFIQAFEEVTA